MKLVILQKLRKGKETAGLGWIIRGVCGAFTALGSLVLTALMVLGAVVAVIVCADMAPVLQHIGQAATGRAVAIGHAAFGWDDDLAVALDNVHLPGPPWGTARDMVSVDHLSAVIDARALIQGRVILRRMRASGVHVYLERNSAGLGNWVFDEAKHARQPPRPPTPEDRVNFPTLLDARMENSTFRWRTSSGDLLRLNINAVGVSAADEHSPAEMTLDGRYNRMAARLYATTDSFDVFHDPARPFGTDLTLDTDHDVLKFRGTMTMPLDFDGILGVLSIDAPSLDDILGAADSTQDIQLPNSLAGQATKTGDHWELDQAVWHALTSEFQGRMILDEGRRGEPDKLALDLATSHLRLKPIVDRMNAGMGKKTDWRQMNIVPDPQPGALLRLALRAAVADYGAYSVEDATLRFSLLPAKIELEHFAAHALGGDIVASARLAAQGRQAISTVSLQGRQIDITRIFHLAGVPDGPLAGRLNFGADLDTHGATAGNAVDALRGAMFMAVRDGAVDRRMMRLSSADLSLLVDRAGGMEDLPCLAAGMAIQDGRGHLAPLQVRAESAALRGVGVIDFRQPSMDILLASDRAASGAFALDLPFRVSGPLDGPHVRLAVGENADAVTRAANAAVDPALARLGMRNACF